MVHGTRNEPSKCPWIVLEIHLPYILSKLQWRFLRDCGCGHCKNRQCQNYRHFAPLLKRENNTSSGKIFLLRLASSLPPDRSIHPSAVFIGLPTISGLIGAVSNSHPAARGVRQE
jgi:hypothetical protein